MVGETRNRSSATIEHDKVNKEYMSFEQLSNMMTTYLRSTFILRLTLSPLNQHRQVRLF